MIDSQHFRLRRIVNVNLMKSRIHVLCASLPALCCYICCQAYCYVPHQTLMKVSFIVEGQSGPGNRRSGSLSSRRATPHGSNFTVSQGTRASLGGPERCPRSLSAYIARLRKNSDNMMKINKNMPKLVRRSVFIKNMAKLVRRSLFIDQKDQVSFRKNRRRFGDKTITEFGTNSHCTEIRHYLIP